jgi:hypothetical protein
MCQDKFVAKASELMITVRDAVKTGQLQVT